MTNEIDWQAADLNEAGEWVEVPEESILPKWLLDEYEEVHIVVPYLEKEFCQWLMKKQGLKEETASRYVQSYMSVYDSLHEKIGLDLYGLLHSYLVKIPKQTKCDITKEVAPFLVREYIDAMQEILDEHPDAYTGSEKRSLFAYHDFIADLAGMPEEKLLEEKSIPLQDEDKFLSWLMSDYHKGYSSAHKIVSSVRRIYAIAKSFLPDSINIQDAFRVMPEFKNFETYKKHLSKNNSQRNSMKKDLSDKTIYNYLSNMNYYLLFLKFNESQK